MKFCQNCGTQVPEGSAACPTCGNAVEAQAQAPVQQPVQQQAGQQYNGQQPNAGGVDVETDKVAAILSYFGFLSLIVMYAMKPQTPFGQFHAKQGVNLFIIDMIVSVGGSVIRYALSYVGIPFLGSIISIVSTLIWILSIVGLIYAVQGKMEELPVIGKIKIIK